MRNVWINRPQRDGLQTFLPGLGQEVTEGPEDAVLREVGEVLGHWKREEGEERS